MEMKSNGACGTIRIKERAGWFPAGSSFHRAMTNLSDGAFKLFTYICLEADPTTGKYCTTHKALARALRKSRRSMAKYVLELACAGVCDIYVGKNQHEHTSFLVRDEFWPYSREETGKENDGRTDPYVVQIRDTFLSLGCTQGRFSGADEQAAIQLKEQGVPINIVREALLLGACRKYGSWLEGGSGEPIGSLRYFQDVIAEVQKTGLPDGYSEYLHAKIQKLRRHWRESNRAAVTTSS